MEWQLKTKVRGALGALWVAVFSSVFLGMPGRRTQPSRRRAASSDKATGGRSCRRTLDYDLEEKKGSGTGVARASQPVTSFPITGRVFGLYQYRVRACNAYGCSGWLTSSTVQVGTPPAAPTLTVRGLPVIG